LYYLHNFELTLARPLGINYDPFGEGMMKWKT